MGISLVAKAQLGKTNLMAARIGCGLIRIGRNRGIDEPGKTALPDKSMVHHFLRGAVESGVNFFDTAPAYGKSEQLLGGFIKEHSDLSREMIIATKCGESSREDGTTVKDYSPIAIRRSVDNSLHLLGGHIHLLQIHSINLRLLDNEELLRTLEDIKKQGDIDYLGVTCTTPPEAVEKALTMGIFSTIQVPYNCLNPEMGSVISLAGEKKVGVIVNRPLATGLLSSKNEFVSDPTQLEGIRKIKEQIGEQDLTEYAWRFIFNNPSVSVVLTGTRDIDNLKENLRSITKK